MTQWYYADRSRQRQGPIEAAELAALFRSGQVAPDTLVWREGLTQWQALGDFAGELGLLDDAPAPAASPPADAAPENATVGEGRAVFEAREPAYAPPARDYVQPDSPYAAPSASVAAHANPVHGGEVVYAGFWKRYAAASIDNLLLTIVLVVFLAVAGIGLGALDSGWVGSTGGGAFIFSFYAVLIAVAISIQAVYFTWMHASASQATLGKQAVGIKVTDIEGNPVSTSKSFGRWAGFFFFNLLSCGIVNLVSAFMAGLSERKQALHDMAAGTLVVDKWAFTDHPEWQRRELGTITIVVIVLSILLTVGYLALSVVVGAMGAMGRH
ncbi:MAG: RDD family protein [Pseudoxanthomonas sp.]